MSRRLRPGARGALQATFAAGVAATAAAADRWHATADRLNTLTGGRRQPPRDGAR